MNVSLIGYRGSGKSTVARLLADRIGWQAVDADDEIERVAGKSIKAIFADDGEPAFRDIESAVAEALMEGSDLVIAWGGGVILRDANRRLLTGSGPVVWLKADAETALNRIQSDPATSERRPNLTSVGGLEEITAVLAEREPIYRRLADMQVETQGKTPSEVADEIGEWLDRRGLLGE